MSAHQRFWCFGIGHTGGHSITALDPEDAAEEYAERLYGFQKTFGENIGELSIIVEDHKQKTRWTFKVHRHVVPVYRARHMSGPDSTEPK